MKKLWKILAKEQVQCLIMLIISTVINVFYLTPYMQKMHAEEDAKKAKEELLAMKTPSVYLVVCQGSSQSLVSAGTAAIVTAQVKKVEFNGDCTVVTGKSNKES